MKIFLPYATVEGQTGKIARHIASRCEAMGHSVTIRNASEDSKAPLQSGFDCVIAAGPVHAGSFPSGLNHLIAKHHTALMAVPGAFISVSLAAASDDPAEVDEIADCVHAFSERTGWWPVAVHHAAGALKYSQYDFFRKWMLKRIATKEGGPTDTSADYEFTDWAALDVFVEGFLASVPEVSGKI